MTAVIETNDLGKQYGRKWALRDCTLSIPEGKVVGLVGPNGAGKTTLLSLAVGLLTPTRGSITVLAGRPGDGPAQLEKVGFVAQDTPAYAGLSVGKHLLMGAYLNATWDQELAKRRIDQLGLDLRQKAGSLSGGQRAQLALTMAIAKQPELLPGFRSSTPAWSTDLAFEVRRRQRSRYAARVSRHWRYRRSARRSDEPGLLALLRSDRRIPVYIACWLGIAGRNE